MYLHVGSFSGMFFFALFLGVFYKHQEQQKGQGTKQQSQREGETETVTREEQKRHPT